MPTRRFLVAAALVASLGGAASARPAPTATPADMTLGNPKAAIEVIEYASLSCPHCAHFNETVFVPFRAKWVDTGKVRFTLKEMLTASPTVAMAGFLIARCAGSDRYFKVVDDVYRSQPRWEEGQIKAILKQIAADNGVDEPHFDACLRDTAAIGAVNERARRASEQDGVESTPTLFINGVRVDPLPLTPAEMDAAIAAADKPVAKKPVSRKSAAVKGAR